MSEQQIKKTRKKTKKIKAGNVEIGGDSKISVQSMVNASANDYDAVMEQIKDLKNAGCDIVRLAVVDFETIKVIAKIKDAMAKDDDLYVPLVADIHFNYRLAIEAAFAGVDKIRINPGNIGSDERVKKVVDVCRKKELPIRIGVNSGSLEKHILEKHGVPNARALAESAMYHVRLLEKFDFDDIAISIKSSDVNEMTEANMQVSELCNYPLHIGVTSSGSSHMGLIKNAIGIGTLLSQGIGDTMRVSLAANPVLEVCEGIAVLKALNLYYNPIEIIACPTCGRCNVDIIKITNECEKRFAVLERNLNNGNNKNKKIKVAVMGCAVNGPGEAKEADIGIAGGKGEFLFFKKGEKAGKINSDNAVEFLTEEVSKFFRNGSQ